MEDLSKTPKQFMKHVFHFNEESKGDFLNVLQYALVAVIPIVLLNKVLKMYVPQSSEYKKTPEILMEVIIQILFVFIGLIIIHRITTFVPTFSGVEYPEFHMLYIVLSVLLLMLELNTELGEKVNILYRRTSQLWNNREYFTELTPSEESVKSNPNSNPVTNPILNDPLRQAIQPKGTDSPSPQYYQPQPPQQQQQQQQPPPQPSSNQMKNQVQQQMMMSNEPLAANEGGGFYSSANW